MDYVLTTCLHLFPLLLEIIQHIASVMHLITKTYTQILSCITYYISFLPSVVRDSNELPHTNRNAPSISAFKRSLNLTQISVPRFYLDGKRIGQIYHFQLRMDCSSLNHHLFSKNIIDSPLCICGRPETTKHFLFNCNRFNNLRLEMT